MKTGCVSLQNKGFLASVGLPQGGRSGAVLTGAPSAQARSSEPQAPEILSLLFPKWKFTRMGWERRTPGLLLGEGRGPLPPPSTPAST